MTGEGRRVETTGAAGTRAVGRRLGAAARPGDLLLLDGPVGAGKTVLADGVLDGLGIPGPHPSPTFTLVRVYQGRLPAAHVDLYRLAGGSFSEGEIDLPELLAAGGVTVVEWAEVLAADAPADALHIRLRPGTDPRRRLLEVRAGGPGAARWAAALGGGDGGR